MEISWKVVAGAIIAIIALAWIVFKQSEQIGRLKAGGPRFESVPETKVAVAKKSDSKFVD